MHPAALLLAIQLLHLRQFHPDEIDTRSGDRWMALIDEGKESSLREVTVHVKHVQDIMDRDGEKTGKEVSITPKIEETSVIVLVRGLELHEGAVPTATYSGEADVDKPLRISLPHVATKYTLSMTCKTSTNDEMLRCPLVLSANGERQNLFVYTPFAAELAYQFKGLDLIWAGDLDGDGKLDLLVDTTNGDNSSDITLYLSSKAKSGQLVGRAARLLTVGC